MAQFTIKMTDENADALKALIKEQHMTAGEFFQRCIDAYLEKIEDAEDIAAAEDELRRIESGEEELYPAEEVW